MFGAPEPADRLRYDAAANKWKRVRTTVQMGAHVEDMGSTHGIIYMLDESLVEILKSQAHSDFIRKILGH